MIAVVAPGPDQVAGVAQVGDQVLVEALVPQASVEALDDPVLHGFPRRNVAPFNAALFLPPSRTRSGGHVGDRMAEALGRFRGRNSTRATLPSDRLARRPTGRIRAKDHSGCQVPAATCMTGERRRRLEPPDFRAEGKVRRATSRQRLARERATMAQTALMGRRTSWASFSWLITFLQLS